MEQSHYEGRPLSRVVELFTDRIVFDTGEKLSLRAYTSDGIWFGVFPLTELFMSMFSERLFDLSTCPVKVADNKVYLNTFCGNYVYLLTLQSEAYSTVDVVITKGSYIAMCSVTEINH